MKTMQGEACLACSNKSRTRLAPTPTNISTKSEPEIEKNGTPASPATALASSVLPVPGGPYSSTPLGILAPIAWKRDGFSRNSLISWSSSTASSQPATSEKVTFGFSSSCFFARDLPNCRTRPPPCIVFMIRKKNPTSNSTGNSVNSSESQIDSCCSSTVILALVWVISVVSSSVYCSGNDTVYSVPSCSLPVT